MRFGLFFLLGVALAACAYPRRSTSISPVRDSSGLSSPVDLWTLTFVSAVIPPRQRSGQSWDDDDSPPDVFIRLYRDDELLFESDSVDNQLQPSFENATTENLKLPGRSQLRLELWDQDQVGSEPIGIWQSRGLPRSALPGANATVTFDGSATLTFRVAKPEAHRGTGVPTYEVRGSLLRVVDVLEYSPAGRAGLRSGDSVITIDGQAVSDLGDARAASLFSMVGSRGGKIEVVRSDGQREELELDGGYIWLAR